MSQFNMMIPIQGGGATLKAAGESLSDTTQTSEDGDLEGLTFTQILQDLSQSNPNAAALLLSLQQAGFNADVPITLQTGGSTLPVVGEAGGKSLPLQQLEELVASGSQQGFSFTDLKSLDPQQLRSSIAHQLFSLESAKLTPAALPVDAAQSLATPGMGDLSGQLHGLGLATHSALSSGAVRPMVALPVQVPVGQPGWDNAVGERIQWMVSRNLQHAEIKLTPPDLGPMEIKISLHNDQTSVNFIASHAATRDALEAAIPRLREMFGGINLNLANVDVGQHQSGSPGGGGRSAAGAEPYYGEGSAGPSAVSTASAIRLQSRGVLDTYA
jgi:flagellar hook-length control protein FliK